MPRLHLASMPEDERETVDVDDYVPWDFDNDTYSESDVFDLLDDGISGDDE